jgi:glycosyltransferase involved in cell wall biosynthesis
MQIADLGLEGRVVLAGAMADVRPLLRASRLSVLASTAVETFSIAMLESMAMQVPVLATNIGGLREAIAPGVTGDLMEPGNIEEMTQKIRSLMSDAAKCEQMGIAARALVVEKFRNEDMAAQMDRLFLDAVAMQCQNSTN